MNVLRSEHRGETFVLLLTLVTDEPATPAQVKDFGGLVLGAEAFADTQRLNEPSEPS